MPVSVVAYYPQVHQGTVGPDYPTPQRRFGLYLSEWLHMEEVQRYRNCDMPCSGRPRATTAVDVHYLRISACKNPDSNAIMLNNAFRAAIGGRITTLTVRNRLHDAQIHSRRPWRGPSLQRGTDGPNNMLNGPLGIGITFSSPMSVAYAFNQTIVGLSFGGNLVRLIVFETVSSECSKVVVP